MIGFTDKRWNKLVEKVQGHLDTQDPWAGFQSDTGREITELACTWCMKYMEETLGAWQLVLKARNLYLDSHGSPTNSRERRMLEYDAWWYATDFAYEEWRKVAGDRNLRNVIRRAMFETVMWMHKYDWSVGMKKRFVVTEEELENKINARGGNMKEEIKKAIPKLVLSTHQLAELLYSAAELEILANNIGENIIMQAEQAFGSILTTEELREVSRELNRRMNRDLREAQSTSPVEVLRRAIEQISSL